MNYGLKKERIRAIIKSRIERNPDLKYYINNDYIYELVDDIVEGVSEAIYENTEEVIRKIKFK